MSESQSAIVPAGVTSWQALDTHALERLPFKVRWSILIITLGGVAVVFLSFYLEWLKTGRWISSSLKEDVTGVLICTFVLIYLQYIKRVSIKALTQLRSVVPISEEKYQRYARRMLHADLRIELGLLALAVAIFVLVEVGGQGQLGLLRQRSPLGLLATVYVNLYTILAVWIFLTLIYTGLRSSLALRALAHSPLVINAFDPTALLPFGRLAALHSVASAGVVLIPLLVLGMPRAGGGYVVFGLSFLSLGVLFVPLWGVHRQIMRTREQLLDKFAAEFMQVQVRLLAGSATGAVEVKLLHEEAERLTSLRKHVISGPAWPFRDYGTVARVVTAVFLPTLVTFLSFFIERVIFPILAR